MEPVYVQPAERTETAVRKAQRQVFNGVYPPGHLRSKPGEIRDLEGGKGSEKPESRKKGESPIAQEEEVKKGTERKLTEEEPAESASSPVPSAGRPSETKGRSHARPLPKKVPLTPEVQPFEARHVRFGKDEDSEMPDALSRERTAKLPGAKSEQTLRAPTPMPPENEAPRTDSGSGIKAAGRQSELTATMDKQGVMECILNMEIPMSL
jgi:hypothetical protein